MRNLSYLIRKSSVVTARPKTTSAARKRTIVSRTTERRGATSVEFALCLPILLAVIFGIMEFSRVTQLQQTARLAAFEGARAGIPLDATTSDINAAISRVMSAIGASNYTSTINPNPLTYNSTSITVSISLDPTANAWQSWFISSGSQINASITLVREISALSVP